MVGTSLKFSDYQNLDAVDKISEYFQHNIDEYFIQPSPDTGIGTVKLDIIGEQTLTYTSDVTDHYSESNSAIQDNISKPPAVYNIKGYVGELYYYNEPSQQGELQFLTSKLTPIATFLPSQSVGLRQAQDTFLRVAQITDTVDNFWKRALELSPTQNHQQQVYNALKTLRDERIPINVTSPWNDLKGFIIIELTFSQNSTTREMTEINITLKEYKQVSNQITTYNPSKYQSRAADERATNVQQGVTTGLPQSLIDSGFGART